MSKSIDSLWDLLLDLLVFVLFALLDSKFVYSSKVSFRIKHIWVRLLLLYWRLSPIHFFLLFSCLCSGKICHLVEHFSRLLPLAVLQIQTVAYEHAKRHLRKFFDSFITRSEGKMKDIFNKATNVVVLEVFELIRCKYISQKPENLHVQKLHIRLCPLQWSVIQGHDAVGDTDVPHLLWFVFKFYHCERYFCFGKDRPLLVRVEHFCRICRSAHRMVRHRWLNGNFFHETVHLA